jgi:hypothetical protein
LTQEFFNYLILSCWVGAARLILCFRVKCIPNGHVLKHYQFPNVFLGQIKKVYISFVTPESFEHVQQWLLGMVPTPPTCNAIRHACRRRGINMDMHFCRKIHSLWLHQSGIVSEEIDLLQGRVNPSVFSRRYLTPIASLQDKVLETPNRLNTQLQIDDDNNWQYLYKLKVMPN